MNLRLNLAALCVAAALAPAAFASAPVAMPADLPPFAPDRPLPVPEVARHTLDNGLQVWIVPRDGVPRVDYVLVFRNAGLAADAPETPAFASMLAGLLTEGTAARDSREIAEQAQGLGGGIGGYAATDGLAINANSLPSKAAEMAALLAEVARTPNFPQAEIDLAKANALQGLKASEAQPGFRAERAMLAALYGDHPYARTQATEAGIAAVDRDTLVAEHARRLRPDNALLVIAGRIGEDEALALVKQHFGDWRAEGEPPAPTAMARNGAAPTRVLLKREGSVQSTVRIGRPAIRATHPDSLPLELASTVLGGSFSSRLMQNLREDKGYTYGARLGQRRLASGGALVSSADVRNEVTGAAVSEFFAEFNRLANEPVPAAELEMNKRYVAGSYLISNQLQRSVAGSLAGNWLLGLPPEYIAEYVPRIREVTAEQVQAMGRKYFQPAQQSIVVVGDEAVLDQLKPYGEFKLAD
ncbi:pitrilysin family protein [Arenimonas caeni]|jgi:zinc protease|uniref:M16 family metallopeptidase n=1 Tax=Arenimonas caeni TaxID=2058085 RepID=UPI002A3632E3|nr:pitrilysin family protein [Arenimonas caeni]MDY0023222.1 pitrilysin family protein [Arenimonas caeni]